MALEKAAKCPVFPLNLRRLSQKLKFWEILNIEKHHHKLYILEKPSHDR
jgi:hypothetical protein